MKSLLFFVAVVLATTSAQAPSYLFSTTSQIDDGPVPEDVGYIRDHSSFARSPQFYAAEPEFASFPLEEVNQYSESGPESPLINAIAPPAFVKGQVPLAVSPVLVQYRTQYDDGGSDFGYTGGPNSRTETRDANGNVRGAYIYLDSNGNVQSRRYVADEQGYRVVGTDIPKETFVLEDTPEVIKAKEALERAYDQARARLRRSISYPTFEDVPNYDY